VSLGGLGALAANLMWSFEEPHAAMLVAAAVLVMAAPVGMLAHLAATSQLTLREKRMWVVGLAGGHGPALLIAYFNASKRRRVTRMLVEGTLNRV
jgi:hypothetical protein